MRLSRRAATLAAGSALALAVPTAVAVGASADTAPASRTTTTATSTSTSTSSASSSATVTATSTSTSTSTTPAPRGQRSLAALLGTDRRGFDRNAHDYDVLTGAVGAVLAAKPNSPVAVLADGSTALTAFLPNDGAFRLLVKEISGKDVADEKAVLAAVAGLGIDTVETVLLYHVVPGATITSRDAVRADGASLTTAQGGTLTVGVSRFAGRALVQLADADANDSDPVVVRFDLNRGNRQIAHGINRVLRPVDLP